MHIRRAAGGLSGVHFKKEPIANLKAAGRHWATPALAVSGDLSDDLAAFGLDPALAEGVEADIEEDPEICQVLPENWPAVKLFLMCSTQWRYAGMTGVPTGLDYTGVHAAMQMQGVEDPADTFERLRTIESAALDALSER